MITDVEREQATSLRESLDAPAEPVVQEPPDDDAPSSDAGAGVSLTRATVAALLSSAAAAWMLGGVFDSALARPLALLCAAAGVGWTLFAARTGRMQLLGFLLVPATFVVASLASVAADSRLSPLEAVRDAISGGGLLQPPVPFDAGWRFLLVALCVLVAAATTTLVVTTSRPRLALAMPLPVVLAGALLQPSDSAVTSAGISLVLAVAGLMVLYAAELGGGSGGGRTFELRRSLRGGAALAAALVALVVLNHTSFLFPAAVATHALPPQKPQVVPLDEVKDHAIAVVRGTGDLSGPWRLGSLDVYDGSDFLLPAYDPQRLRTIVGDTPVAHYNGRSQTYSITVVDPEQRVLLTPAGTSDVNMETTHAQWDPLSQTLVLPAARQGVITYTVTGEHPPSAQQLGSAGPPPASLADQRWVPTAPPEIRALLARAPTNPWDRLQYVRQELYDHVLAAGAGVPGPVPPASVVAMLAGGKATPYEIAAAQVLLARWAGLPARLGYGYYGGDARPDGSVEFRPKHGANWAEVWFDGYGWVPIIGKPAHAVSPLDANPKNHSAQTQVSREISVILYVPTDESSALQLYQVVRWWLAVLAPFAAVAVLAVVFAPWPLKLWRSRTRRRRAARLGPAAVIATEYAEFRDLAADLRAGDPYATPLQFLDRVSEDAEHEELAWLVTRALWGDLARDLQPDDVAAARDMAASLRQRLRRGQPWLARVLALASRASLREPYDPSLYNAWPAAARRPRRRRLLAFAALASLCAGCGQAASAAPAPHLPSRIVPAAIDGYTTHEESTARAGFTVPRSQVVDGRLYTMRSQGTVYAALEIGVLRGDLDTTDIDTQHSIRRQIGSGAYRYRRLGDQWVADQPRPDVHLVVWFPDAHPGTFEVLTVSNQLPHLDDFVTALIRYQEGR